MAGKRTPKKPDRPLVAGVFPKKGRAHLCVEHPPREQKSLEETIGTRFLNSLAHFHGLRLCDLQRSEDPADLACRDGDTGTSIKIQIAEAIDHDVRRARAAGESYAGPFTAGVPRGILSAPIHGKIQKHYWKPREAFWLLVYSTDSCLLDGDPEVSQARELLATAPHRFDAVWYLFPYPKEPIGHVLRLWPVT